MVCGKETQDNCHISQSGCPAKIPWTYRNVVLYSPDPPFPITVLKGGSGDETILTQVSGTI